MEMDQEPKPIKKWKLGASAKKKKITSAKKKGLAKKKNPSVKKAKTKRFLA